jgi:hypothetical protein
MLVHIATFDRTKSSRKDGKRAVLAATIPQCLSKYPGAETPGHKRIVRSSADALLDELSHLEHAQWLLPLNTGLSESSAFIIVLFFCPDNRAFGCSSKAL